MAQLALGSHDSVSDRRAAMTGTDRPANSVMHGAPPWALFDPDLPQFERQPPPIA
jgi:hypothetical protein